MRWTLYDLGWQTMRAGRDGSIVRASREIGLVESLEAPDRLFMAAVRTGGNPQIDLQMGSKFSGTYLDPETGAELGPATLRESAQASHLVPGNRPVVLIVLRRAPD